MKTDPIFRLKGYLKDPLLPTWSSQGLIDMFSDIQGDMKERQQIILPIIDDELHLNECDMTSEQYHFMRDVTLHAVYSKTQVEFSLKDLKWLLDRFDNKQTQQRATLISMLLRQNFKKLSEWRKQKIKKLLAGTLADQNWDE